LTFTHLRQALKELLPGKQHKARRRAIEELALFATGRPAFTAGGAMFVHLRIMREHGGWFGTDERLDLRYAIERDLTASPPEGSVIPVLPGQVEVKVNRFLRPDDLYFQADGLTTEEHAKIRAAEEEAKRQGEDHRRARLMATIETGKVRTIHCGPKMLEDLKSWCGHVNAADLARGPL
jgi:hypothetical protein